MLQRAKLKSCDGWLLQDAWTSTAEFSTTDGAIFWMDPAAGPAASVSATIVLDLPSGPLDLLSSVFLQTTVHKAVRLRS